MKNPRAFSTLCVMGVVLCGVTAAVATTSCFFNFVIECCNLVPSGQPFPILTRLCPHADNCPDIIDGNSVSHFQSPPPVGQKGWPSITPAEACTCTFDRYTCSIFGYCILETPGMTSTGSRSVPSGTYGNCTG